MRPLSVIHKLSVFLLLMLSMTIPAQAQSSTTPSPETVIRDVHTALNQGDIEAALEMVADDAVEVLLPPPPDSTGIYVGKEAIGEWWEVFNGRHGQVAFLDLHTHGNTVTWLAIVTEDIFQELGMNQALFQGVGIVQNGLIQSLTWSMTEMSMAHLNAAQEEMQNRQVVRRFYEEIWGQGNLSVADEIIAVDFVDHFFGQNGLDAFKQTVQLFQESFTDFETRYDDMIVEGDTVVVRFATTATYRGGALGEILGIPDSAIGTRATLHGIDYARIQDGKYVEGWGLHNDTDWLRELGVTVEPDRE